MGLEGFIMIMIRCRVSDAIETDAKTCAVGMISAGGPAFNRSGGDGGRKRGNSMQRATRCCLLAHEHMVLGGSDRDISMDR